MKWVFLSVLTLIFWVVVFLYIHLGISKPVTVDEYSAPTQLLVYKNHLGAYYKINDVITDVEARLGKLNLICAKTFGEFFDDPRQVEEDRLNSRAGCIFEGPLEDILSRITDPELKTEKINSRKTVRAVFQGSPAISPYKVYPKMEAFQQEKRLAEAGPMMEIYEIQGDGLTTTYLRPVR